MKATSLRGKNVVNLTPVDSVIREQFDHLCCTYCKPSSDLYLRKIFIKLVRIKRCDKFAAIQAVNERLIQTENTLDGKFPNDPEMNFSVPRDSTRVVPSNPKAG